MREPQFCRRIVVHNKITEIRKSKAVRYTSHVIDEKIAENAQSQTEGWI